MKSVFTTNKFGWIPVTQVPIIFCWIMEANYSHISNKSSIEQPSIFAILYNVQASNFQIYVKSVFNFLIVYF